MEPVQTVEFGRLMNFNGAAHAYLQANPEERSTVTFALNKLIKHYEKPIRNLQNEATEQVNEEVEDIRVKYCEKDKDSGAFKEKSYGEGNNLQIRKVFTAENERKANKEIKALNKRLEAEWQAKQIELTKVHIVKPVPVSMDIKFIEAFSGFIFDAMSEEELFNHYLAQSKDKKLEPAPSNGVQ